MGMFDRLSFLRRGNDAGLPEPVITSSKPAPTPARTDTNVSIQPDPPRPHKVMATPQRTNTSTASRKSATVKRTKSQKPSLVRTPSVQTRYMEMLLQVDQIPRLHNILAAFFTWVLLAGYLVFPATFASLQNTIKKKDDGQETTIITNKAVHTIRNIGLLWVAGVCCVVGAAGMTWLWWRWRTNYVWLINRIFLPGLLNSIAGVISTVINVTTSQHNQWSVTAKVTAIVTGACTVVTLLLFTLYNFWVLQRIKSKHAREVEMENQGHQDTIGEKIKHAANAKPLEPGSVV